jgi:hypothetical protein
MCTTFLKLTEESACVHDRWLAEYFPGNIRKTSRDTETNRLGLINRRRSGGGGKSIFKHTENPHVAFSSLQDITEQESTGNLKKCNKNNYEMVKLSNDLLTA